METVFCFRVCVSSSSSSNGSKQQQIDGDRQTAIGSTTVCTTTTAPGCVLRCEASERDLYVLDHRRRVAADRTARSSNQQPLSVTVYYAYGQRLKYTQSSQQSSRTTKHDYTLSGNIINVLY